ncbi:hypothetical protein SLA2020_021980 [Shorea laevis]
MKKFYSDQLFSGILPHPEDPSRCSQFVLNSPDPEILHPPLVFMDSGTNRPKFLHINDCNIMWLGLQGDDL